MKKLYLLLTFLCFFILLKAQVSKTVEVTAGNLNSLLSATEKTTITNLTLTGNIDARDFFTIRFQMSALKVLDLSHTSVVAFSGDEQTGEPTQANVIPNRALQWESDLTTLILPSSVTAIDIGAFWGCSSLSSVTIPPLVTSIADAAFMECSSLAAITLPSALTEIGIQTFDGCTSLSSISIPATVTSIGNKAFNNCSSITQLVIPSGVSVIEKGTFSGCSSLTSVTVPSSVTAIGENAFYGCSNLTSIELPPGITAIEDYCFSDCKALTGVTLPSPVTTIGINAFSDCSLLGSITIPPSVTAIGNKAFSNCTALNDIVLPVALKEIEPGVFYACSSLTSITIPASVTSIGDNAFEFCNNLTSVIIPSSVNYIGIDVFSGCTNIHNIWSYRSEPIPLYESTFSSLDQSNCTLHVPYGSEAYYAAVDEWKDFIIVSDTTGFGISANSLRFDVGGNEFQITVNSTSAWQVSSDQPWVTISPLSGNGNGTVKVSAEANNTSAFRFARITFTPEQGDPQVISVTQKSNPVVIPITAGNLHNALTSEEMDTITSLTLTGTINVNDIDVVNAGFPRLTYLDLSNTKMTSTLAYYGYYPDNWWPGPSIWKNSGNIGGLYKKSLKTLKLPSTVEVLGSGAFSGSGITTLTIPSSVKTIGWSAFAFCLSLETITIPANVEDINQWVFDGCTALKDVVIEAPMTSIPRGTFAGCSALTEIILPPTVQSIQMSAFGGCSSLSVLNLPAKVSDIENAAFFGCKNLSTINSYNPYPPSLYGGSFGEVNTSTCIVNVPVGSAALYAIAEGWKDFQHIVEALPGFNLSANAIAVKGEQGSTGTVLITSNVSWTATSDQSWLSVSPSSGSSTRQLTFTAEANPSMYGRSAMVTFSSDGLESRIVTVTQEGLSKIVNLTAGNLSSALTAAELKGITHLTITGEIDARDFETMTKKMPLLVAVDLSQASVKAWSGDINYAADAIPEGAFSNKRNLTFIRLPETISRIGSYSFTNCTGLTAIRIPQTVTLIEYNAFSNCINLDSIYSYNPIPPEGTTIGADINSAILMVPYGAKGLYQNSYGWKEFKNIVEMHGFKLSANVVSIKADNNSTAVIHVSSDMQWSAQADQSWISIHPSTNAGPQIVTLTAGANPSEFGRMGTVTFSAAGAGTQSIKVIQEGQPKTVNLSAGTLSTVLSEQELTGITNLTITGKMDARDFRTMRDRMPMLTVIDISQATIQAYTGPDGTALTYHNQMPYAANEIPLYAFFNDLTQVAKETITSVYLPKSIIAIGQSAFYHCSGLRTIKIPSFVRTIEDHVFSNCYYLDSIFSFAVIPPDLWSYSPFYQVDTENCKLYVPYGSASLYKKALFWQDFDHLIEMPGFSISDKTINVANQPNSTAATSINANVTWTASSDQKWLVVSPTTGTGMNTLTFTAESNPLDLGRMATVSIDAPGIEPQAITIIQEGKPKTVNLVAGTLSSRFTEKKLMGITNLTITGEMDARDFRTIRDHMPLLTTLDMSKAKIIAYTGIDGTYETYYALNYPANTIPFVAFYDRTNYKGKSSLTSVLLPESITYIAEEAFANCTGLSSIIIPSSVIEIAEKAFYNCRQLMAIYSYPVKPPYQNYPNSFGNIDKANCILYVPYGSKAQYKTAYGWRDFQNIVEMGGFELSAEELTMEVSSSVQTIQITTEGEWSTVCDKDWLTVSPVTGEGQGEITLSAKANEATSERVAIVTVSAADTEAKTIIITQHGLVTGMDQMANQVTVTCYPNPFTSEMAIEIANPSLKEISVEIFSMTGQKIRSLAKALKEAIISLSWDGADEQGRPVAEGMYLLKVNGEVRKVVRQ